MPQTLTLPGLPSMVPAVRAAVRGILEGCPRCDDAELIVSELAGNVVRHSRSGQRDGVFRMVVDHAPGWARLEVVDQGPRSASPLPTEDAEEYGRGLLVVAELADKWGHDQRAGQSTWWAELNWEEPPDA